MRIKQLPLSPSKHVEFPERAIQTFLAEDSPLMTALLARILSGINRVTVVGSATDGWKAVCYASTLCPDLVLTDLNLPGLDGAEVTRRLKHQSNPPIIFVVTSDDTPESRARCLTAGADAFFVKGLELPAQLKTAIRNCFPMAQQAHP